MISLSFDEYSLPPNAKLLIYNWDRSSLIGPYTSKNNQTNGLFSTSLLIGDSLILEYYEPLTELNEGSIAVSRVIHAYSEPFAKAATAANCHTSVCEAPDWCNQIRSVGIIQEGGGWLCSGVLLTNVERNYKPYFLTALHCGDHESRNMNQEIDQNDSDAISGWVVYFNNQDGACSTGENYPIHGATVKSYDFRSDYLLVELNESVPEAVNAYYAGWNAKD